MDPNSRLFMLGAGGETRKRIGTMTWAGTNDTSVTIAPGAFTYTTVGNTNGLQTYGDTFQAIDSIGLHLDVRLLQGFETSPTRVAWLGVCNTASAFNYNATPRPYTAWYWSGAIWFPDGTDRTIEPYLAAGAYRIALRTELGVTKFYIRKFGDVIRGPYDVPTGTLRLMMLGQGGFPLPEATILNAGAVYEGGGGLF